MIAGQVHAVIAAGLGDPALLVRWRQEPDLLRKYGVDPDAFDFDALWMFAGLATKVRHNGLRSDLPLTFRLLNIAGMEIEVFASYASFRAAEHKDFAATSEARAQDLLSFLEQWLDFDRHEHALLWDLIRHELALARLRRQTRDLQNLPTPEFTAQRRPSAATAPRVCGAIILHEMRSDPRAVGELLRQKSPRLDEVSPERSYFCYWHSDVGEETCILQLDELGFYLLSLVDGKRSTADISCLMGGSRRPLKGLLRALAELASLGILKLDRTSKRAL